jgi:hypothetical protein
MMKQAGMDQVFIDDGAVTSISEKGRNLTKFWNQLGWLVRWILCSLLKMGESCIRRVLVDSEWEVENFSPMMAIPKVIGLTA